jgi:soluble lytic murein transglycosylase-like protein
LRASRLSVLCAAALLVLAAPASARVAHTVQPGETLWSIAAANNFTTRSLAAANGLSPEAQVVLGSTVWIPSEGEAATALGGAAPSGGSAAQPQQAAPPPAGSYTVQPGDTLTGIAARSGVRPGQVAFMNGLDPDAHVIAGTVLKLPAGAPPTQQPQPAGQAPKHVPDAEPYPTPGYVTSAEIGQVAAAHGVPASLASAVAWQESGFNNGLVSSANARGVMQILPGTWRWIEDNVAYHRLDPASPHENVHAGVMYLGQLLKDTGGNPATTAAAYYQGLGSVRDRGMFRDTKQYVKDVLALRGRFGGP